MLLGAAPFRRNSFRVTAQSPVPNLLPTNPKIPTRPFEMIIVIRCRHVHVVLNKNTFKNENVASRYRLRRNGDPVEGEL